MRQENHKDKEHPYLVPIKADRIGKASVKQYLDLMESYMQIIEQ